eukprot:9281126-Ditylum_brightwellii.AAC.1
MPRQGSTLQTYSLYCAFLFSSKSSDRNLFLLALQVAAARRFYSICMIPNNCGAAYLLSKKRHYIPYESFAMPDWRIAFPTAF